MAITFERWFQRQLEHGDSVSFDCSFDSPFTLPMTGPERVTLRLPFNWRLYRYLNRCRVQMRKVLLEIASVDDPDGNKPLTPATFRLAAIVEDVQGIPRPVKGTLLDPSFRHKTRPVREMGCVLVYTEPPLIGNAREQDESPRGA